MAWLKQLKITGLRNIEQVSLRDFARFNLFYGGNGAGKTSLLEAIHILGLARSFRGAKSRPLIKRDAAACTVFGQCSSAFGQAVQANIGVHKVSGQATQLRLNGGPLQSAAELATTLPLQVLNADSFQLLLGSPRLRRQYMDWGVFHVEQGFLASWRSFQKALKQRNSLLRRGKISAFELAPWDQEFSRLASDISVMRSAYVEALEPLVFRALEVLWPEADGLTLAYQQGWDKGLPCLEALVQQRDRDARAGHSTVGPHRADIRLRYNGQAVSDVLSRGQLKVLAAALRVAQGALLKQQTGIDCLFLVDDLPAELDGAKRKALCGLLDELKCQVFITCIDKNDMDGCGLQSLQSKVFHVEQGVVSPCE